MASATCPKCSKEIADGARICPECGNTLVDDAHQTMVTGMDPKKSGIIAGFGSASFQGRTSIVLYVKGGKQPVVFRPEQDFVIGRRTATSTVDLDLGQYEQDTKTVSRQHAVIRLEDDQMMLYDLGSRNGTFVNEKLVSPDVPNVLHDGDVIRVGQVVLHIYFQK